MAPMRILIPDTWHFHRRNFAALYDHFAEAGVETRVERTRWRWWKRHGDYAAITGRLLPHVEELKDAGPQKLIAAAHREIPLLKVARSEFLCRVLPEWAAGAGPREDRAIVERACRSQRDQRTLLLCLAAATDWIDFWHAYIDRHGHFSHALAFSGSYIYTRALQEVAVRRGLRVFTQETFFTGNDFYFEERATPLPNQSFLRDPAYGHRLALPQDPDLLDRLRAEAQIRLRQKRNKNVRVDAMAVVPPPFGRDADGTVLVLGQVLNDFSIIETPLEEMSTIATYQRLIGGLLERSARKVIFKAHPWERRRPNLMAPVTLERMRAWRESLPASKRERFKLMERESVSALFPYVDWAVGLSSQALIEAAQAGLKPIQLGSAFFGEQGFTHDRVLDDGLIADLAEGHLDGRLTLTEYRALEDFLVRALVLHLVSDRPDGAAKIARRLAEPNHIPSLDEVLFTEREPRRKLLDWIGAVADNPIAFLRIANPGRRVTRFRW
jgi:hypothetical protein